MKIILNFYKHAFHVCCDTSNLVCFCAIYCSLHVLMIIAVVHMTCCRVRSSSDEVIKQTAQASLHDDGFNRLTLRCY